MNDDVLNQRGMNMTEANHPGIMYERENVFFDEAAKQLIILYDENN